MSKIINCKVTMDAEGDIVFARNDNDGHIKYLFFDEKGISSNTIVDKGKIDTVENDNVKAVKEWIKD